MLKQIKTKMSGILSERGEMKRNSGPVNVLGLRIPLLDCTVVLGLRFPLVDCTVVTGSETTLDHTCENVVQNQRSTKDKKVI